MEARLPGWMTVMMLVQLVVAGLFGLLAYSMTSSLARGAPVSLVDTIAVALPVIVVAACWFAARALSRSGQQSLVPLAVFAPPPICVVLLFLSGAVL